MLIVAGLSLKNLHPRVWDPASPFYLPRLGAVMVSYAEFHQMRRKRQLAMELGLHAFLGCPPQTSIFLDNGSFFFLKREGLTDHNHYVEFVTKAKPDWYPIPQDFIPSPSMSLEEQTECLRRTMINNLGFQHNGFIPVLHISQVIEEYVAAFQGQPALAAKPIIALGGIVPNLLRMPKARPYRELLQHIQLTRKAFRDKELHLFGVGGTATLHLATLLGMDSVDSSGWRNRAARGIVQLPGGGDRLVADLGKWRGRPPNENEWQRLVGCKCPPCQRNGLRGLCADRRAGFDHRATHNLWVLLEESGLIQARLDDGTYAAWYEGHLDNSIYVPLIRDMVGALASS